MVTVTAELQNKRANEQEVFYSFLKRQGMESEWTDVSSRPEPEPDLLCINSHGESVAFELVSLTDPQLARVLAAGPKAHTKAFFTSDPSEIIVRKKLGRSYKTAALHIELLIYTDGRIITPDDVLIPTIVPLLNGIRHPFRHVWFMGEHAIRRLWSAP